MTSAAWSLARKGPEAGVWVIAETRSTPTHLIRIVVTDDRGRFVVPDLPSAEYDVWVRGYGLIDSPKTKTTPGKIVNLRAIPAPDKKAAAQYYPAQYWLAMLQIPPKSDFPGTGERGNGISANIRSQGEWIRQVVNTDGCTGCHQMGGAATRTIPASILSQFPDTKQAWDRRLQSGQAGGGMNARFTQVGKTAGTVDVCRLDRPHRKGRIAGCDAVAPSRQGTKCRRDAVGLGRSESVSAR